MRGWLNSQRRTTVPQLPATRDTVYRSGPAGGYCAGASRNQLPPTPTRGLQASQATPSPGANLGREVKSGSVGLTFPEESITAILRPQVCPASHRLSCLPCSVGYRIFRTPSSCGQGNSGTGHELTRLRSQFRADRELVARLHLPWSPQRGASSHTMSSHHVLYLPGQAKVIVILKPPTGCPACVFKGGLTRPAGQPTTILNVVFSYSKLRNHSVWGLP